MTSKKTAVHYPVLILTVIVLACMLFAGISRIHIEKDIIETLPQSDPVLKDAKSILGAGTMENRIVVDIEVFDADPETLFSIGKYVEDRMRESGLFNNVGMENQKAVFVNLMDEIVRNLPFLFEETELKERVSPLLEEKAVRESLEKHLVDLAGMSGIGQTRFMSSDPLGLKNIVLKRLKVLSPPGKATWKDGFLLSENNRHILIPAEPKGSGTESGFSKNAMGLFEEISKTLKRSKPWKDKSFRITPFGAFRAAFDNENAARNDIRKLVWFSTLGICVLLFFSFPRPWLGLLSLVPAVAGTITALFVYSLFHPSLSVLALGFGGALISITVDHGIAYMLFLDRPIRTSGKEASEAIRSVGLVAALTSVGAFSSLVFSGFPVLGEIGVFSALGIGFAFLFVHTVFPVIISRMPPAKKTQIPPLQRFVDTAALSGGKPKLVAALLFAAVMAFFAKPSFQEDIRAMNTMRPETKSAERRITNVWGDLFSKVHLLTQGNTLAELRNKEDRLDVLISRSLADGTLASGFSISMIFPGKATAKRRFNSWKRFWSVERVKVLKNRFSEACEALGFQKDAFEPFFNILSTSTFREITIPKTCYSLFGLRFLKERNQWIRASFVTPGNRYSSKRFFAKFSNTARVFDPVLFSKKLGMALSNAFTRMAVTVAASIFVILFAFFRSIRLTVITVLPVAFAFISTLGIMRIIDHPIDIPGLMLSIVILGMGIDYSVFFVCARLRFRDLGHPYSGLFRLAVFLASASTIIGFGVLCTADHNMLKSAGIVSFTGITLALFGTFMILPALPDSFFHREMR